MYLCTIESFFANPAKPNISKLCTHHTLNGPSAIWKAEKHVQSSFLFLFSLAKQQTQQSHQKLHHAAFSWLPQRRRSRARKLRHTHLQTLSSLVTMTLLPHMRQSRVADLESRWQTYPSLTLTSTFKTMSVRCSQGISVAMLALRLHPRGANASHHRRRPNTIRAPDTHWQVLRAAAS